MPQPTHVPPATPVAGDNSAKEEPNPVDASVTRPQERSGLKLALLAFAQFVVAIDYNIVYVALPDIGRELGFTAQSLQWVVSAYAVTFGGFLLLGGRAADRLGQRRMFMLALGLYAVSSLGGGLADEPWMLLTARAVQGLGGALLFPTILSLINTSYAEGPERNRALTVWGVAASGGLAAGALLGGLLTNGFGWKAVFLVNVPLALGAAIVAPRLLAADAPRERGQGGFDLPGAVVATAGICLVVFGLASGPEAGWSSGRVIGSLLGGLAFVGAFILLERNTPDPLAPPRLLGNRSLAVAMIVILLLVGTLGGEYYLYTTYLQGVLGYSPLAAGLAFLPLTLISMVGGKISLTLLNRQGIRPTVSIGMLGTGIGLGALATGMSPHGSFIAVLPGLIIWGLGAGIAFSALFVAAASGVSPDEQGVASALASTSQQLGSAVGLAVIVAVARAGLNGHTDAPSTVVDGLRTGGWAAAAAAAAGAIVALALKHQPVAAPAETAASPEGTDSVAAYS